MDKKIQNEVKSIIEEIEGFDELIRQIQEGDEPMFSSVVRQIEQKKKRRYKELLGVLLQSNIHFEELNEAIVKYLKKDVSAKVIEEDFASQLQKAKRMLA